MIDGRGKVRIRTKGLELPELRTVAEVWRGQSRVQGLEFWTGRDWAPGEVASTNAIPVAEVAFSDGVVTAATPSHPFLCWKEVGEAVEDCFEWVALQDLNRSHVVAAHDDGGQRMPLGLLSWIDAWIRERVDVGSLPSQLGFMDLRTKDDCLVALEWVEREKGQKVPGAVQEALKYDFVGFRSKRPIGGVLVYDIKSGGQVVYDGVVVGTMG